MADAVSGEQAPPDLQMATFSWCPHKAFLLRAGRQTAFPLLKRHRFPGGSDGKEPACHVGDQGSIPGSGRSPGEGNGYPLQYFCLENPMDGGAR